MLNEFKYGLKEISLIEPTEDRNELIAENWGFEMKMTPDNNFVVNNLEHERFLASHGVEIEWFDSHARLTQNDKAFLVEIVHNSGIHILFNYNTLEEV